jgi:16S rRNA (adenine1518-N6/adenine1519-N6)-dimethyltransferase
MTSPHLKKRLGQHHLVHGGLCRPLLDELGVAGQRVLEIGPGGGVLTAELLAAGAQVLAAEVDAEWAFALRHRFAGTASAERLSLAVVDALDIDYSQLPAPTLVTGNLPFNVATRIIEDLLPHADAVPRAAFMVQKEVAERLVARPGDSAYGSLSVIVAAYADGHYLGTVKPGSFRPPPKVAGAFVGFRLRPPPLPGDEMPGFVRLVRLAFAKRRKTLRNALAAGLGRDAVDRLLDAAGLDTRCRAETLGLEAFVELHRHQRRL